MINKVILMGRLTADPEHRQTQSGISMARFSIAVQRSYADKNTGARQADFINVIAWRNTADFVCRYFTKGKMIIVEGAIQTGSYDDKNTGVKRYTFDIVADQVHFDESKSSEGGGNRGFNNEFSTPEPPPMRNNFPQNNFSSPEPHAQSQASPKQPAQNQESGYSVGEFWDETGDDDDDDFPY